MINRRVLLSGAGATLAEVVLSNAAQAQGGGTKVVFQHDLPDLSLKDWSVTVVEVTYPPGASSPPHRHPGVGRHRQRRRVPRFGPLERRHRGRALRGLGLSCNGHASRPGASVRKIAVAGAGAEVVAAIAAALDAAEASDETPAAPSRWRLAARALDDEDDARVTA